MFESMFRSRDQPLQTYPRSFLYNSDTYIPRRKDQVVYNTHCHRIPLTDLAPCSIYELLPQERGERDCYSGGLSLGLDSNLAINYQYVHDPPLVNKVVVASLPGMRLAKRSITSSTSWYRQTQLNNRMNQDLSALLTQHFEGVPEEEIPEVIPLDIAAGLLADPFALFQKQILKRSENDSRPIFLDPETPFVDLNNPYKNFLADEIYRREATSRGMLSKRAPEQRPLAGAERIQKMRKAELLNMSPDQKKEKKRADAERNKLARAEKKEKMRQREIEKNMKESEKKNDEKKRKDAARKKAGRAENKAVGLSDTGSGRKKG